MSSALIKSDKAATIMSLLETNREKIERAVPKHVNADHLMRVAIGAVRNSPKLAKCTEISLFGSIIQAVTLGLEPSGYLGEAYLVPYKETCTLIIGYRGYIALARRSGDIAYVSSAVLKAGDYYKAYGGTERRLEHHVDITAERGDVIAAYATYKTRDGHTDYELMSMEDIHKRRAVSAAWRFNQGGPWKDWPEEMAQKTAIRRLMTRAPISVEMGRAIQVDNQSDSGATDHRDVIETTGLLVPEVESLTETKQGELGE